MTFHDALVMLLDEEVTPVAAITTLCAAIDKGRAAEMHIDRRGNPKRLVVVTFMFGTFAVKEEE